MSPLPERRKTAEELAELRKSLGIPGAAAGEGDAGEDGGESAEATPAGEEKATEESAGAQGAEGKGPAKAASAAAGADGADGAAGAAGADDAEGDATDAVVLKPVRSLKRSERIAPIHPPKPVASESGKLPAHRHSERELMELRMSDLPRNLPAVHLDQLHLGRAKVAAIYLLSLAGYGLVFLADWASNLPTPDLPARWIADFVHRPDLGRILSIALGVIGGLVLLLSGLIWWKKPRSRHHAAFLTIIAVLVLVFGILHFLPEPHGA